MTSPSAARTSSRYGAWKLLWTGLAPVAGIVLGLTGFLGAAILTSSPAALFSLGAVGLWTGTAALAWRAAAWRTPRTLHHSRHRQHATRLSVRLATAVLIVVGTAVALSLRPLESLPPQPTSTAVHFWTLPDGSRLAYVASMGANSATRPTNPVVFLHGGPGTPGEGLPPGTAALNAAGFDVYAYDQIGAGRSSRLIDVTQYTVARQVADLETVRHRLKAQQLILVGRSWGATLAASYLATYPQRVDRVVFVSPGPLWQQAYPDGAEGRLADRLTSAQQRRLQRLLSTPRMLVHSVLMEINPAAAHALVPDAEADTYFRRAAVAALGAARCPGSPLGQAHGNLPGYYTNQRTSADANQRPDPRPTLRRRSVKALILRGECDFLRPAVAQEYREVLHGSVMLSVAGAGHDISGEQTDLYVHWLMDFLLAPSTQEEAKKAVE